MIKSCFIIEIYNLNFMYKVIQISLFCLCIGREPYDLKLGIVNNETIYNTTNRNASLLFVQKLSDHTFDKVEKKYFFL